MGLSMPKGQLIQVCRDHVKITQADVVHMKKDLEFGDDLVILCTSQDGQVHAHVQKPPSGAMHGTQL